jgi:hypothetical protein
MKRINGMLSAMWLLSAIAACLCAVSAFAAGNESRWWMREGKGYGLCEAVYKELLKYTPEQAGPCMSGIILSVPGMKEIDGWQELNPLEHEELYKRLVQYREVGVEAYFGRNPQRYESKRLDPSRLDQAYRELLGSNLRMGVNTVQLFTHPMGDPTITYAAPQTVLELRDKEYSDECPAGITQPDRILTYYVAADLSGPSPDIRTYEAGRMGGGAQLIEYKNKIHLMRATPSAAVFHADLGRGVLQSFCEIQSR